MCIRDRYTTVLSITDIAMNSGFSSISAFNRTFKSIKGYFFQKVYPDVVGGLTGTTVALVVGAVEILDFRVALIEVEVQIAAAVCADKQAGEHIVFLSLIHICVGCYFGVVGSSKPIYWSATTQVTIPKL